MYYIRWQVFLIQVPDLLVSAPRECAMGMLSGGSWRVTFPVFPAIKRTQ